MVRLLASLVACLLVATPAFAEGAPFSSVSCGDHWLTYNASIDDDGARVWLAGDSQGVQTAIAADLVTDGSEYSFRFLDGSGQTLTVDASDAVHGLFWGQVSQGDVVTQLGLCSVE